MFEDGQVRLVDPSLRARVANLLAVLDAASSERDLAGPGNRLHELQGDQQGCGLSLRAGTGG
jgi:plasmid maintenance system killer protein